MLIFSKLFFNRLDYTGNGDSPKELIVCIYKKFLKNVLFLGSLIWWANSKTPSEGLEGVLHLLYIYKK